MLIHVPIVRQKRKTEESKNLRLYIFNRYNGTNPGNLTPRAKDKNTGLSFSTIPPINNKTAAVTTIEEVNSTGNLIAVQDGPSHVSIKPRNGTMSDWIKAGTNSIWTKNIKANCKTVSEVTFL